MLAFSLSNVLSYLLASVNYVVIWFRCVYVYLFVCRFVDWLVWFGPLVPFIIYLYFLQQQQLSFGALL